MCNGKISISVCLDAMLFGGKIKKHSIEKKKNRIFFKGMENIFLKYYESRAIFPMKLKIILFIFLNLNICVSKFFF